VRDDERRRQEAERGERPVAQHEERVAPRPLLVVAQDGQQDRPPAASDEAFFQSFYAGTTSIQAADEAADFSRRIRM